VGGVDGGRGASKDHEGCLSRIAVLSLNEVPANHALIIVTAGSRARHPTKLAGSSLGDLEKSALLVSRPGFARE